MLFFVCFSAALPVSDLNFVEGWGREDAKEVGGCTWLAGTSLRDNDVLKLQAQVYDILPSTTAVFSYAIGSRKLSANEQFFVGARTAVSYTHLTLPTMAVV